MTLQRCSENFATHNLFAVRPFAFDFWTTSFDKWIMSHLNLISNTAGQPAQKAKTTLLSVALEIEILDAFE